MQNAKDSFYIALRNRLAVANPERVTAIRGVQRPGILAEEAEAAQAEAANDVFVLRWTTRERVILQPHLWQMGCELHYKTCGTAGNAGLDRGRALAAMDDELLRMLLPPRTPKLNYTQTPPAAMETQVFWDEPVLGAAAVTRDALSRVASVAVYSLQEPGEP